MGAAPLASRIFDANGELLLLDVRGLGGVALQLSGTFTLTVQFEATVDGQTWVSLRMLPSNSTSAATNATAAGAWSANVAGFKLMRARVSAYTSGSADVTFLASSASGRIGSSGGDAETLDGEDGSYYLDVDNVTAGTLAVARGGTGAATHTSGNYLKGAGTGAITSATAAATFADVSPLTTRGDLLVGTSGSVTGARLAKGSSGNVLTMADANDIGWAAPSGGGGKILQVVYGVDTSSASSSSSTMADTGLTASITPSDDDNKILVLVSHNGVGKVTSNTRVHTQLLRDSTTIAVENSQAYTADSGTIYTGSSSWSVLDDPQTDSEIVYKTQFMSQGDSGTVYVGLNSSTSTMVLLEVDV
jgi:hypothetical protein